MPTAAQPGVVAVEALLSADELVAAWRRDTRRLVLPARDPLRVHQRIAARIIVAGTGAAATITGRVVSSSREETRHRIELVPDETRVAALERLVALARGEVVEHVPRIPRFLVTMPAVVHGPAGPTYMTTFSVSENGCGLAWSGPVPEVGAPVDIRLGAGQGAARLRGIVCWTNRSGRAAMVGVRFLSGARHAWAMTLAELERAGALPA
jgi:hypothetical protein